MQDNQKDLESATETLSEYLERDITSENLADIKQKVQDKYRSVFFYLKYLLTLWIILYVLSTYNLDIYELFLNVWKLAFYKLAFSRSIVTFIFILFISIFVLKLNYSIITGTAKVDGKFFLNTFTKAMKKNGGNIQNSDKRREKLTK